MMAEEGDDPQESAGPEWLLNPKPTQRACIIFEGAEVCGPVRFEEDKACVFDGQRWVCA